MSNYKRGVATDIWNSMEFVKLSTAERLLYLNLLTSPETSECGIYSVPVEQIALRIGCSKAKAKEMLKEFEEMNLIVYDETTYEIYVRYYSANKIRGKGKSEGVPIFDMYYVDLKKVKSRNLIDFMALDLADDTDASKAMIAALKVAYGFTVKDFPKCGCSEAEINKLIYGSKSKEIKNLLESETPNLDAALMDEADLAFPE